MHRRSFIAACCGAALAPWGKLLAVSEGVDPVAGSFGEDANPRWPTIEEMLARSKPYKPHWCGSCDPFARRAPGLWSKPQYMKPGECAWEMYQDKCDGGGVDETWFICPPRSNSTTHVWRCHIWLGEDGRPRWVER